MAKALSRAVPGVARALAALPPQATPGLRSFMMGGHEDKLFPAPDSPYPSVFFEVTVALSLAVARSLRADGCRPCCAAGRSVGEFSAFAFAGAVTDAFCFRTVREFSRLGQRNCLERPSLLLTVYGVTPSALRRACRLAAGGGLVCEPVNSYSRLGTGVAGMDAAAEPAFRAALPARARVRRCREVGAFHTSLFADTAAAVSGMAARAAFRRPELRLYCASDARRHAGPEALRSRFARAVDSPVLWEETLRAMLRDGVNTFVELAPGAMLTEFILRLPAGTEVLRTDTPENYRRTVEALGGRPHA